MPLNSFHPLIQDWFQQRFAAPTPPQIAGWPAISAGRNTLIAAPTGSGKTLTAFLAAIDRLLQAGLAGNLKPEMRVVYVSPLRALSNDMHRNLEVPLAEIQALAIERGQPIPPLRAGLRTGDTSAAQRAALIKHPPHILVTTPESLYLLLTSERGRERLATVDTVIVDEIHALVRDKRGAHLSLNLERLDALCGRRVQRIGLSATQRPIADIAAFLVGCPAPSAVGLTADDCTVIAPADCEPSTTDGAPRIPPASDQAPRNGQVHRQTAAETDCCIIDVGHQRDLDLGIEIPQSELNAVCMHEQWAEVNARLGELIGSHRSTLIFVNTRRMAERVTHQLTELLGADAVSSHHGSLSADRRLDTEQRLKHGRLKAVVATASLELGLDIGYIDLVVQLGSPRSIATFLQRVGRSGHALGLVPKGRLFALTRDELMECMALLRAVRAGRLDRVVIPEAPLDILAQCIVAEISMREWPTADLFALAQRAYSFRNLRRSDFDAIVQMLSEGIAPQSGRGRVYLHHDQVHGRLRARPGARISATTSGGAIPEVASYRVVAEPERTVVGTLDEDFATESQAGEIFLLGNTSWRIRYVRGGDVTVTDAQGAPPTIPFWRGEAPGRTVELSTEVSSLRQELETRVADEGAAEAWLVAETLCSPDAARQIVLYAAAQRAAVGLIPSQRRIIFERFFDESGGMQLVIHAPFGARITHAWGLAMRKRFCRSFDFELQASADDDGIVLSLGPQHSFPLESLFGMLNSRNVRPLLEQALLAVPTFQTRWRWNVTRALLVLRQKNGKKVPPALQRFRADDLLTAVFPKLTGCQENVVGDIELPDHPLVRQSMHDSLHEAHDVDGLVRVLEQIERGEIELVARDTREPSPFSYELLNVNPYAFLDGGEAAERRARAVSTRRSLTVDSVRDLGWLDPQAIERVRQESAPLIRSADELHDVLLSRVALPVDETEPAWSAFFAKLRSERRATVAHLPSGPAWVPAERLPLLQAAHPAAQLDDELEVPAAISRDATAESARLAIVRGLLEVCGPIKSSQVAQRAGMTLSQAEATLEGLEGEGLVLRGRFTPPAGGILEKDRNTGAEPALSTPTDASSRDSGHADVEWCHRRLLARIHRLTMEGLRRQIEPVGVDVFFRFLSRHHGLLADHHRAGPSGLLETIGMVQGLDIPAIVWERDILPRRMDRYRPEWLDELCLTGEVGWGRLFPTPRAELKSRPMAALTRAAPLSLFCRSDLSWLCAFGPAVGTSGLSGNAMLVLELLQRDGAMFAADFLTATRMLPGELTEALGELVSRGLVTADGFAGLRTLIARREAAPHAADRLQGRRRVPLTGSGRWSWWRRPTAQASPEAGGVSAHPSVLPSDRAAAAPNADGSPRGPSSPVEHWAWLLLRRWGVMFRDLLEREAGAPRWFELLQIYRRLEARGEVRGGRFISGVAGEQFAVGDTVSRLRQLRDQPPQNEIVSMSAADPLNLVGILTPHARVPRNTSNRVVWLDGVPVLALVGGRELDLAAETPELKQRLLQASAARAAEKPPAAPSSGNGNTPRGARKPEDRTQSANDAAAQSIQKNLFPKTRAPRPYPG